MVASQCIAYEPFPFPGLMVPHSDRRAKKKRKADSYAENKQISDNCIGCGLCSKLCPCKNTTMEDKHPVWNHSCIGCNACVVYCPAKAIMYKTPKAYLTLNNIITNRMGLTDKRTRYHNPHIMAKDIISDGEEISADDTIDKL